MPKVIYLTNQLEDAKAVETTWESSTMGVGHVIDHWGLISTRLREAKVCGGKVELNKETRLCGIGFRTRAKADIPLEGNNVC